MGKSVSLLANDRISSTERNSSFAWSLVSGGWFASSGAAGGGLTASFGVAALGGTAPGVTVSPIAGTLAFAGGALAARVWQPSIAVKATAANTTAPFARQSLPPSSNPSRLRTKPTHTSAQPP
jgi:hypothetical protein